MAMTPGGRAPSAPPPPPPPRPSPTPPPARAPTGSTSSAGGSVLRWGFLMGGLVIIADLATKAAQQRTVGTDLFDALGVVDYVLNAIFFSIAGASVLRETGAVRFAVLAGLLAGVLDGVVIAASDAVAPLPGTPTDTSGWVLFNAGQGMLLAAASAWFTRLGQRRGKG